LCNTYLISWPKYHAVGYVTKLVKFTLNFVSCWLFVLCSYVFIFFPADTNCDTTFTILRCLRDQIQTEHWSHSAGGAVVLNGTTARIHEAFVTLLEVYAIFNKCAAVTNRAAHCVKNMELTHHVKCDFEFRCLIRLIMYTFN
jgi:hypothetical protein